MLLPWFCYSNDVLRCITYLQSLDQNPEILNLNIKDFPSESVLFQIYQTIWYLLIWVEMISKILKLLVPSLIIHFLDNYLNTRHANNWWWCCCGGTVRQQQIIQWLLNIYVSRPIFKMMIGISWVISTLRSNRKHVVVINIHIFVVTLLGGFKLLSPT